MNSVYWIWYPADFELYYAMKQNFSRVERGMGWPAFWKSEGFRNRVAFRREYLLKEETSFTVYSKSAGFVLAGEKKYPFGTRITCGPGKVRISVHAGRIDAFPSIYIEGDVIYSDGGWMAEDYDTPPVPAGYSRYFTDKEQDPEIWEYSETCYIPVKTEEADGGTLYEFETELTAALKLRLTEAGEQAGKTLSALRVYCGESREEALDTECCYYSWLPDEKTCRCPRCAVRFAYIPGIRPEQLTVEAFHQYVDIPVRASFSSDNEMLNRIWSAAQHTFMLCSGVFFIDGIKRDKWIWGGDAYQSLFVNQYLTADEDIEQRTMLALRGNERMTTHINTIIDYTLYWILSVRAHYDAYGKPDFVRRVWDKMTSLMRFCGEQTDGNGFFTGREGDWVYIDWADLDKQGPVCAEQMLYAACLDTMALLSSVCGHPEMEETYREQYRKLCTRIDEFYWDREKQAYIDSFESGRHQVTRHANIFAVLFGIADEEKQQAIAEHVLLNERIPKITTPYFKFYELEAMCRLGYLKEVLDVVMDYWGGMIRRGAVTIWEEYDPDVPEKEQYDMYGDRFGKSLCHAWGASPIYLLARYFIGLKVTDGDKGEYELHPHLEYFHKLDCVLPVGKQQLHIRWNGSELKTELTEYKEIK